MTDETTKLLHMMRFWLTGTFLILGAAHITIGAIIPGLLAQPIYLLGIAVAAALTILWYFGYRWWLLNKQT